MRIRLFLLLMFAYVTVCAQTKKINITGFGEIPVSQQGEDYKLKIGNIGEFVFQGNLEAQELRANVNISQLANLPGYMALSKLGLTDIMLVINNEELSLNAHADTKANLKKICDLFNITTPYIEISASVAPKSLELEGQLEFSDGPVLFLTVDDTGTIVRFNSAQISTKLEPGSVELVFSTTLIIKPTFSDPELECTYSFSYDLVSQTLTGSGSMMSEWQNPLGSSKFLADKSIVFNDAAVELGINALTFVPVNLGFAVDNAKIFTLDFAVAVSIDPVGKEVAFRGHRPKMNANDFTTFLREGFGLSVPNVLPDIYYIEEPLVLFSPNGGSVGEVEIGNGMALKGNIHIGDAIQGPLDFKFDMENKLELHMDLKYDYRKFVMNEVHKVKFLAPVVNEVLKTFQVRKLYVDLYANKEDLNFKGKAKCEFEVFGKNQNIEFEATLDPEAIAQVIVKAIVDVAGPKITAIAEAISDIAGPALNASINTAKAGLDKAGTLAKNAYEWKNHLTHGDKCYNSCIPNRARELYTPVFAASNQAVNDFYSKLMPELRKINANSAFETAQLRSLYIKEDWRKLSQSIDSNWESIFNDQKYWGYDKDQADVERYGRKFRDIINNEFQKHKDIRDKLWRQLMSEGNGLNYIRNRYRGSSYANVQQGLTACTKIGLDWQNAMWLLEPVEGTEFFRLKNNQFGTYLHIENGKLECTEIDSGAYSAQWKLESVQGNQFVRIKNRWKGTYLNTEKYFTCSDIDVGATSSHWEFIAVNQSKAWNSNGDLVWQTGQTIVQSVNGIYNLVFQADGNLVLFRNTDEVVWASGTDGKDAKVFKFLKDGNLVIYGSNNNVIWSANSQGKGGKTLVLQDNGELLIHAPGSKIIWTTIGNEAWSNQGDKKWIPGETVVKSVNGIYSLVFQKDGNLVLYKNGSNVIWASGTNHRAASELAFQKDGNMCIRTQPNNILWATNSYNKDGYALVLEANGNLVIVAPNWNVLWTTNTGQ